MTRRALLIAAIAATARADSADDVWDLIGSAVSALSAGNGEAFMGVFDRKMPGYQDLWINVIALVRDGALQSSIDLVANDGDDRVRLVELDWVLRINWAGDAGDFSQRQERVKCKAEKQGKKWKLVAIEPAAFFSAIHQAK